MMHDTGNTGGAKIIEKLKEQGLWKDSKEGAIFTFSLPKEFMWVGTIYPKAYISHFPEWLKEEFARRTARKFTITRLSFSTTFDKFLDETVMQVIVEGRVIIHD